MEFYLKNFIGQEIGGGQRPIGSFGGNLVIIGPVFALYCQRCEECSLTYAGNQFGIRFKFSGDQLNFRINLWLFLRPVRAPAI